MTDDARRRADEGVTWPVHDCHEVLHQHFHNQGDAQWTTCGTCGRIVAFRWKNEADAVAQVKGEWRTQVTALRQVHSEEIARQNNVIDQLKRQLYDITGEPQ
jgi:hypothetical protein